MGNCSSVSIANLTPSVELKHLWSEEIIFKARFIDDLFMIIDITDFPTNTDFQNWLTNKLAHRYLKFTFEFSPNSINFLDMKISLQIDNKLVTSLFRKPMSKHEFVHYDSNHPKHLLNSLPYSCALRIKRICSEKEDFVKEIHSLMHKFKTRNYPQLVLDNCISKLNNISRYELLRPKTKMLVQNLRVHHPEILSYYNVNADEILSSSLPSNKVFINVPFYKNVFNLGKIVKGEILRQTTKCTDPIYKTIIDSTQIKISFSLSNNLAIFIQNVQYT